MKVQPNKTGRIHSLDSLRAIMMLLGLVIHSALTYGVIDYGGAWTLKDPVATSIFNDFIAHFIHEFRMQIFFMVAGFFGAMLFYERNARKMVKNRISRIVFPFIVFIILLGPSLMFSFYYSTYLLNGVENPLTEVLKSFSSFNVLIPENTYHLWFLYYLAIITFASVLLGLLFKRIPKVSNYISNTFGEVIQKPILRVIIFASLTVLFYVVTGTYQVGASNSLIPDFNIFIYYLIFYLVGWVLFKSKHLLDTLTKLDWVCTILGTALFTFFFFMSESLSYGVMSESLSYEVTIILKSIMVWLFVFGITGLFIRYGSNHSAKMRYISDASYWVYLLHLSLTAIIPSFIVDWPIHAILKFLIVLISTGIICFVSYHYLVRGTFIGKFLNGRKYSKKLSDIRKTEELNKLKPVANN